MSLMFLDSTQGTPIPPYTCKHCGEKVWFLIHKGRWWKCKECFEK